MVFYVTAHATSRPEKSCCLRMAVGSCSDSNEGFYWVQTEVTFSQGWDALWGPGLLPGSVPPGQKPTSCIICAAFISAQGAESPTPVPRPRDEITSVIILLPKDPYKCFPFGKRAQVSEEDFQSPQSSC